MNENFSFKMGVIFAASLDMGENFLDILHEVLLPVRPPSLTYLTLGVMMGPYARDVVYLSGHWRRGWQTTFPGDILFL